ncbi:MAG: class I tRNA ligase family protein [Candidatus Shikimatogenerans sp. Ttur]|uniref:leucine--tRNA ligase n=1 Tax=Candidatus Shikimatogenerans sp. Ttur TaxID=3158569 RepID=A0AAU7ZXU3_9FLAO
MNFKKNIYKTYKTKYEALHPTNKNYIPIYISNYINYKYNINVLIINPFNKKNNIFLKKNNILFFKIKKNFFKKKKNRKKFINKYTLYKKNIYNMRDIILSRQKYWGEPIPIYYKNNIPINIKINNLPLILPNIKKIKSLSKINK